ncbi:MAG: hypothetical protein JW825_06595 [Candidatus Methanofastidiosa archaeon]|nr:hypothetical protein [Candidatus Methanofastidiosa archaeon]
MEQDDNVIYFNVRDIGPYNDEKDKATEHVAGVIGRTLEDTGRLISEGKVFLFINKETEETWFEVFE